MEAVAPWICAGAWDPHSHNSEGPGHGWGHAGEGAHRLTAALGGVAEFHPKTLLRLCVFSRAPVFPSRPCSPRAPVPHSAMEVAPATAAPAAPAPEAHTAEEPVPMSHGLTPEQVAACMVPNKNWPRGPEQDGWVLSHNAIRLDLVDFTAAFQTLSGSGGALTQWQVATVTSVWKEFERTTHSHHDHEVSGKLSGSLLRLRRGARGVSIGQLLTFGFPVCPFRSRSSSPG